MSEEKFFDRLREHSSQLRYEPRDSALWTRLPAKIRERVRNQPTVAQMLARWVRPVTASFVMLAVVAALSVTWIERSHESSYAVDVMGSNSLEISVDGDTLSLAE